MEKTEIINHFQVDRDMTIVEPFGNGHINDTFLVKNTAGEAKYILQRINHTIFKDVDMLQNNIGTATLHIREKLVAAGETDIKRKVLNFLPIKSSDKTYFFDGENYWRVCNFIRGSKTYEEVTPELSYEAGKAFGRFQSMLSDLPEGTFGEIIPNFHNMEFRLKQFQEAIKTNAAGRLSEVQGLVDVLLRRAETYCIQERLYREGQLMKRVNHCDSKVNNILFSESGEVLCVIDLDTVMPGFVLSDIGDFIRTACNTGAEDDADLSRIHVNMDIFKAYTRGYLETASVFLTPLEKQLLPYGGRLLTYMQTVRFLTDYLNGDTYYKIHSPKHNLQRTLAQFKFLQELEDHTAEMDAFVA
ncbi:MAG: aminoglycoside phosphotransferase family protein [Bacteroidales bacterium]|jgi:Ser/Thr protein kinase RdoA (MazF antagonist)|nr:aminoglycoside phosphotransferase family protein [Bacteroidales bacterium]